MPASSQVWASFVALHRRHAVTIFSHVVGPPAERGTTWSKLSSRAAFFSPQYWQRWSSRRYTLRRPKRTPRPLALAIRRSRTTAGTRHVTDGERITSSYSTTTSTVSSYFIFTASCQRDGPKAEPRTLRTSSKSPLGVRSPCPGPDPCSVAAAERSSARQTSMCHRFESDTPKIPELAQWKSNGRPKGVSKTGSESHALPPAVRLCRSRGTSKATGASAPGTRAFGHRKRRPPSAPHVQDTEGKAR
jgi:hypothetical protein